METKKQSIMESTEYSTFAAFAFQPDLNSAYETLKKADESRTDKVVPSVKKGKDALKKAYDIFKKSESLIIKDKEADYKDSDKVMDLFQDIKSRIAEEYVSLYHGLLTAKSHNMNKFNIGRVIIQFTSNLANDKLEKIKKTRQATVETVAKHGDVRYGAYGDGHVFTPESKGKNRKHRHRNPLPIAVVIKNKGNKEA